MKKQDPELVSLLSLPWVSKAVKHGRGYLITTKAGKLRTAVHHKLDVEYDDNGFAKIETGARLEKPVFVKLPQYRIYLTTGRYEIQIALLKAPKAARFIPYPQYGSTVRSVYWADFTEPCLGAYEWDYDELGTAKSRANFIAQYLQSAIPEEGLDEFARFAWYMGTMPGALVIGRKKPQAHEPPDVLIPLPLDLGEDDEDEDEDEDEDSRDAW